MKPEAGLRVAVERWTIGLLAAAVTLALAVGAVVREVRDRMPFLVVGAAT